jgi:hypothetical protein
MSRIQRNVPGTSYQRTDLDDGRDMDTADRIRDQSMHEAMHEARGAEMDARNQPRMETADIQWRRPMSLEAPPPRPGMAQRWVRVETRNEVDRMNLSGKMREGWRPRSPATVPGCEQYYSVAEHAGQETIRVGGLVLFEIDERILASKRRAINEQIRKQEESVRMETAKISAEGARQGFAPIEREESGNVSTGRRPPTLSDF